MSSCPDVYGSLQGLVLENISYAFRKPNILDIKLGTVFYEDTDSEEKKQRRIKAAEETTSLETGIRIIGFEVCNLIYPNVVETPLCADRPTLPAPNSDRVTRQSTHSTFHLVSFVQS
jgi:hypothetical protein